MKEQENDPQGEDHLKDFSEYEKKIIRLYSRIFVAGILKKANEKPPEKPISRMKMKTQIRYNITKTWKRKSPSGGKGFCEYRSVYLFFLFLLGGVKLLPCLPTGTLGVSLKSKFFT